MRWMAAIRRWGVVQWSSFAGILGSVAAVIALFAPGGGGDEAQAPTADNEAAETVQAKEAARQTLRHFHAARFDALWELLHPVDKDAVPRRRFVSCQERAPAPVRLLSLRLSDPVPYPRRMRPQIPMEDVRVVDAHERTLVRPDAKPTSQTVTVFLARWGDGWAVLLPPDEFASFQRGGCPYVEDPNLLPPAPEANRGVPSSYD